jgi:predicted DNA-binding protein (MmcQ/YjbR family)
MVARRRRIGDEPATDVAVVGRANQTVVVPEGRPDAIRDSLREFALGLPGAWQDQPWGETVVKVNKRIFVFLGVDGGDEPGMSVKLTDSHDHALSMPKAAPSGYGLGKAGWITMPLEHRDPELLCEWIEESYRNIATKKLVAELDSRDG